MDLSAETISFMAGALISLVFSYIPKVKTWFQTLTGEGKRLTIAGSLLLTCIVIYVFSCFDIYVWVTCDRLGAIRLVGLFVACLIGNQATYSFTNKKK